MKKYYWMENPTPKTTERHNKIIQILGDGVRTVRNITYKLYPNLHGRALDNAYNTTTKDTVKLRTSGKIRYEQIKETRAHAKNKRGYHNIDELKKDYQQKELRNWYSRNKRPSHKQPIEVWFEKETIIDDVEEICDQYDIPTLTIRGQPQWSSLKKASDRITDDTIILYFGDNDKIGREIYETIQDYMSHLGTESSFRWCGITTEQEEEYELPPESRIDGLDTEDLQTIIEETILEYIDEDKYKEILDQEEKDRAELDKYQIKIVKK